MYLVVEFVQGYVTVRGIQVFVVQREGLSSLGQLVVVVEGIVVLGVFLKLGFCCIFLLGRVGSWEGWGYVRGYVCKGNLF